MSLRSLLLTVAACITLSACGGAEPSTLEPSTLEPLVRTLVQTRSGALRGVASGGVERFLGIPYAAPPVGELRFAPPAPPPSWTGERDASQPGPICMQSGALPAVTGGSSEDCLSLNVYRPAGVDAGERLPVVVWLHGGSFVTGAGSIYDPQRLVEHGNVLVVTVNYRLGALGFLALPGLTSESAEGVSGDYGLMDQTAALRWVRDEIGAFGGDAQQVTLQGQSAGGASVCAQLAAPSAAGLFARAIIQSASCASVPLPLAEAQGVALASTVGCSEPSSAVACLRALPAEQLAGSAGVFGPVVGGEFLPSAPYAAVASGEQHLVPLLVGGVSDEMRGFAALEYPLDAADYLAALARYFPAQVVDAVAAVYPLEAYDEAFYALSAALSDSGAYLLGALGGCVTEALTDAASVSTPIYAYELDDPGFVWSPSLSPLPLPRGASHSSELPYLFDIVGFALNEPFGAAQNALAEQMVRAWGAFARSGDPGAAGGVTWPRYDTTGRQLMFLEPSAVGVVTDFRQRHHCDFWQATSAAIAAAPAD